MDGLGLETLSLVFALLALGGAVKGVTGIGLPLVAVTGVASVTDVQTGVATIVVPIVASNLWQALRAGWPGVTLRRFWPVVVPLILGLWWSSGMVATSDARTLYLVLGTTVVVFSTVFAISPRLRVPRRAERWSGGVIGAVAGVIGGFTTVFGPPISMYLLALDLKKEEFIQAVGILFFSGALPMMIFYWIHGVIGPDNIGWSVLACVPVFLGLAIGQWVRGRVDQDTFRKVLLAMLFVVGLNLLRRALV
ncbi:MAG: sulfite exporter TauE/SafE family protein [Rhodospirillales bacterium]|nr:sulfite exporter TauE/SafE family protein [Rhodospirillales bacterium]